MGRREKERKEIHRGERRKARQGKANKGQRAGGVKPLWETHNSKEKEWGSGTVPAGATFRVLSQ